MKLRLRRSKDPAPNAHRPMRVSPTRLIRVAAFTLVLCYALLLLYLLYDNVFRSVLLPKPIDASQVTARQEKVNRTLLEKILKVDEDKQSGASLTPPSNPF